MVVVGVQYVLVVGAAQHVFEVLEKHVSEVVVQRVLTAEPFCLVEADVFQLSAEPDLVLA